MSPLKDGSYVDFMLYNMLGPLGPSHTTTYPKGFLEGSGHFYTA